jgi:YidC/Oxa1 family membrane protein insertase
MNKKIKRLLLVASSIFMVLALSGCVKVDKKGNPTGEGIVYDVLVRPMGKVIEYFVHNLNLSYGLAIILVTVIVRFIILPLGLHQSKKAMVQQEKMRALKPILDPIQAKMKNATNREDQMAAQMELQQAYKQNGVSMFGGIGCLPLLIQMPIFSALFYAAKFTQGISDSTFHLFGVVDIPLGKPSIILTVIVGIIYFAQSYVSLIGVPEEQKKQMKTMLLASPIMIIFMSFSSPAGVALYWVVGGFFAAFQTLYTNLVMKPRIRRKIEEEMKINPPKMPDMKDVTPANAGAAGNANAGGFAGLMQQLQQNVEEQQKNAEPKNGGTNSNDSSDHKGRNAGKQHRN